MTIFNEEIKRKFKKEENVTFKALEKTNNGYKIIGIWIGGEHKIFSTIDKILEEDKKTKGE